MGQEVSFTRLVFYSVGIICFETRGPFEENGVEQSKYMTRSMQLTSFPDPSCVADNIMKHYGYAHSDS